MTMSFVTSPAKVYIVHQSESEDAWTSVYLPHVVAFTWGHKTTDLHECRSEDGTMHAMAEPEIYEVSVAMTARHDDPDTAIMTTVRAGSTPVESLAAISGEDPPTVPVSIPAEDRATSLLLRLLNSGDVQFDGDAGAVTYDGYLVLDPDEINLIHSLLPGPANPGWA